MTKLQFRFNYQNNLSIHQENNLWHQIPEERQFTGHFHSLGFKLEPGWTSFAVKKDRIQVFCKQISTLQGFSYYRKDLPKAAPVIFTFTETDRLEKVNGKWVKKGGSM